MFNNIFIDRSVDKSFIVEYKAAPGDFLYYVCISEVFQTCPKFFQKVCVHVRVCVFVYSFVCLHVVILIYKTILGITVKDFRNICAVKI